VLMLRWFNAKSIEVAASEVTRTPIGDPSIMLSGLAWLGAVLLAAVPIAGLVVRTGGANQLLRVIRVHGLTLADSLLWALVAGLIAASLALPVSWRARQSRCWATFLLVLTAIAWVTPAPLVGLGLKTLIGGLVSLDDTVFGAILYYRPSPLPGVWAEVLR